MIEDRIKALDASYAELRGNGRVVDALDVLEECLFLRRELNGDGSDEVDRTSRVYTSTCNSVAMAALRIGNHVLSFELLKKAELITEPRSAAPR